MTKFSSKAVVSIETLGEKLKRLRTEARLSIPGISAQTGIQKKYLEALEAGAYLQLPGEVYVRNILRQYANVLHLNEERVLSLYHQERAVVKTVGSSILPPQTKKEARSVNIPKLLRNFGIALSALLLVGYLGYTVRTSRTPPQLTVTFPAQDFVTTATTLHVEGVAEKESRVRINGQDVFLDQNGHFSERVDLQPGVNVITIAATKERSREKVVERRVIVDTSVIGEGS